MIITKDKYKEILEIQGVNYNEKSRWFTESLYKINELLTIFSNWVAIESDEQPEMITEVMVKYKDGVKQIALFDGDGRYYIEKDDRDVTDMVIEWHKLP